MDWNAVRYYLYLSFIASLLFFNAQAAQTPLPVSLSSVPSHDVTIANSVGVYPVANSTFPVSGTFFQSTQPVSIASTVPVTVGNSISVYPVANSIFPVSGTFWQSTQPVSLASVPSHAVTVSNSVSVMPVANSVFPVSGTFWQATQPISGSISIANSVNVMPVANSVFPVSGTFWQSTQPVSLTTASSMNVVPAANSTFPISALSLPSHPVTQGTSPWIISSIAGGNSVAVYPVANSVFPVNHSQINGIAVSTNNGVSDTGTQRVALSTDSSVQLGTATGKKDIKQTGQITTSSTSTATVLTYTATTGKTLYLNYFSMEGRLTASSATVSLMGNIYLTLQPGNSVMTQLENSTTGAVDRAIYSLVEPIVVIGGSTITIKVDPFSATSTRWVGNFGGYEK